MSPLKRDLRWMTIGAGLWLIATEVYGMDSEKWFYNPRKDRKKYEGEDPFLVTKTGEILPAPNSDVQMVGGVIKTILSVPNGPLVQKIKGQIPWNDVEKPEGFEQTTKKTAP